jgi:hypothetical protein
MRRLSAELSEEPPRCDLPGIAYYFELEHGRRRLLEVIAEAVTGGEPNALHEAIAALQPVSVFTTNFDDLLERAFAAAGIRTCIASVDEDLAFLSADVCNVVKVHGDIAHPTSLVVSTGDYDLYEVSRPSLSRLLGATLQTRTVLFVGYSASDPNFQRLLARVRHELSDAPRNLYALLFSPRPLERLELHARGVAGIDLGTAVGADKTLAAVKWLDAFREAILEDTVRRLAAQGAELVTGKSKRAQVIVSEFRRYAVGRETSRSVIRMRQGYSALSFADLEYPHDRAYSELLRQERDEYLTALAAGCEIRAIFTKRPLFSSDLVQGTADDRALATRLVARCGRLADRLDGLAARTTPPPLIVACSPTSSFSEIAFGQQTLITGSRTDSASGYEITVVSRDAREVALYGERFDRELETLVGASDIKTDAALIRQCLRRAVAILREEQRTLAAWLDGLSDADR